MRLRWVLRRDPHPCVAPQALWSTHLDQTSAPILPWCSRRWTMAGTREEARAHLGLETPRQWPARAMARTTPAWLRRYAIITLTAHQLLQKASTLVRVTAWDANMRPTCADAMAVGRRPLWDHRHCSTSPQETDMMQIPRVVCDRFIDVVCYAASVDKVELRGYPETWLGKKVDVLDRWRLSHPPRSVRPCGRKASLGNGLPRR
jgi:hypothetical protein